MKMTVEEFQVKYGRLPTETDSDYLYELERERMISKFQVLDLPLMAPGTCSNCSGTKTSDRKYVDFGLSLDYYGVVYLCTLCIMEIALILIEKGILVLPKEETEVPSPIPVSSTANDIKKMQEIAKSMDDKIMKLKELFNDNRNNTSGSDSGTLSDNLNADLLNAKGKPYSESVEEPESRIVEQTSSSGSKDFSGFTGFKSLGE